jgi:uncharacterized membrane protein YcaP (DUF421 family)
MEPVIRAFIIYIFLLIVIRFSGRRTLGEMSNFDFVLLLIISEAAQNGLTGEDYSIVNSIIIIAVLIFLDICFSLLKEKWPLIGKVIDGVPTILIYDGQIQKDNLKHSRTDVEEVLDAARASRSIERLEEIKYAILEKNGSISIIPFEKEKAAQITEPP